MILKINQSLFHKKDIDILFITAFCLLAGGIARIAYCIKYPLQPRDVFTYKTIIDNWEKIGSPEQLPYFPLSLWFIKEFDSIFRIGTEKSGIIINMIAGMFIIIFAINISSLLFHNRFISLFVGTMVASHPSLIHFSCTMLRENTYMLFSLLSLLSFMKYIKGMFSVYLVFAGFFSSLAFLSRLEGIEALPLYLIYLLFYSFCSKKRKNMKTVLLHYMLFLTSFFISSLILIYSLDFSFSVNHVLDKLAL